MERAGIDPDRWEPVALRKVALCDGGGCATVVAGLQIAVIDDPLALGEDCARAELVVALFPVGKAKTDACRATLIDRADAWGDGAHAVWIDDGEIVRKQSVADGRGRRPWSDVPPQKPNPRAGPAA
jgi:competence protein ComEC